METLTFYSYKGGSGRSLLLTNAARYLALLGKKVVAIDFDFEAPGLHYKMQIGRSGARPGDVLPERGVVDYLLAATQKTGSAPRLRDYITPVPLPRSAKGELFLMPAGSAPSGEYWRSLTELLQRSFFADSNGVGIASCLELKARIQNELEADYILIDSRTGITELAGVATTLLADKVICLVINNQESLAGARAVMRSFGRAPRLKNQKPIQLFPVLSRISNAQSHTRNDVLKYLNAASDNDTEKLDLKQLYLLSVDTELENEEKLHVGGEKQSGSRLYRDYLALFEAMVSSKSAQSASAARRYDAITRMREFLTESRDGNRSSRSTPDSFNQKEIDEGVTLGKYEKRYADLVAYSAGDRTEALLAAEYVDDLKDSDAWQWWEKNTQLRCVILFSIEKDSYLDRRVFTRGRRGGKFVEREDYDGWIVRWPVSFKALDDPGDRSVSAMLKAVQHGEESFIELLVREWEHSATSTLHGGAPFRPYRSRQILDGLAQVTDQEIETRILWRTLPDPFHRDFERRMKGGGASDDQMIRELHAPLWWRLSVKAKIEVYGSHRRGPMGGDSLSEGMDFLCRDIMGLSVNEDGEVRREVRHIFCDDQIHGDIELPFYAYTNAVGPRDLKIELSDGVSPELVRRSALDQLMSERSNRESDSLWHRAGHLGERALSDDRLMSRLIRGSNRQVQMANLLGAYDPTARRITVYSKIVEWAARAISVDARALANVAFLHEAVRALCHVGRDLDGKMWEDFGQVPSDNISFRPSLIVETFAQYFSFRLLERLEDANMMTAFERLNDNQPAEYQAWNRMRRVPIEEMRRLLLRTRAGLNDQFAEIR